MLVSTMTLSGDFVEQSVQLYIQRLREATPMNEHVNLLRTHWPERYFELCQVHLSHILDIPCVELLPSFIKQEQDSANSSRKDSQTTSSVQTSLPLNAKSAIDGPHMCHLHPLNRVRIVSCRSQDLVSSPLLTAHNKYTPPCNIQSTSPSVSYKATTAPSTAQPNPSTVPNVATKPQAKFSKLLAKMFSSYNKSPASGSQRPPNSDETRPQTQQLSGMTVTPISQSTLSSGRILDDLIVDKLLLLFNYLSKSENLRVKGLFRVSGCHSRVMQLKAQILDPHDFTLRIKSGHYNVHDVACAIKAVLRDLEQSIFTQQLLPLYCQAARLTEEKTDGSPAKCPSAFNMQLAQAKQLKAIRILFLLLPHLHQRLVKGLFYLLHLVSQEPLNAMSANSLGLLFAPHIMVSKEVSSTELRDTYCILAEFLAFHIASAPDLFLVPTSLSQDMSRHWATRLVASSKNLKHDHPQQNTHQPQKNKTSRAIMSPSTDDVDEDAAYLYPAVAFVVRSPARPSSNIGSVPSTSTVSTPLLNLTSSTNATKSETPTGAVDTQYAVAELYAQVQGMPDCAKKRQLIHKLNKTNGGLTPQFNTAFARATAMGGLRSSIRKRIALRQLKHMNSGAMLFASSCKNAASTSTIYEDPTETAPTTPQNVQQQTAWDDTMPVEPSDCESSFYVVCCSPLKRGRHVSPSAAAKLVPSSMSSSSSSSSSLETKAVPSSTTTANSKSHMSLASGTLTPTKRIPVTSTNSNVPCNVATRSSKNAPAARLLRMRLLNSPLMPQHAASGAVGSPRCGAVAAQTPPHRDNSPSRAFINFLHHATPPSVTIA